jgi:hypothetical protein
VPLDAAAAEYSEDRDCHVDFQSRRVIDTPCVVAQIVSMKTRLGDPQLPAAERGLAAAMLIHFIADVHQPLHTVSNNDRGGNSVVASWFGEATNLHAVWDVKILERRYGKDADPEPIAAALSAWRVASRAMMVARIRAPITGTPASKASFRRIGMRFSMGNSLSGPEGGDVGTAPLPRQRRWTVGR